MEVDVCKGCTREAGLSLAEESVSGNKVNRDFVGSRDGGGELEELVDVALCWKWHHHQYHWNFVSSDTIAFVGCHASNKS